MASRFFLCEILNYGPQAERKWYQIVTSLHGMKWRAYEMVTIWVNIRFYIYFIFFFSVFFKNMKFFKSLIIALFCWVCYMRSFMCLFFCLLFLFFSQLTLAHPFLLLLLSLTAQYVFFIYVIHIINCIHRKIETLELTIRILK